MVFWGKRSCQGSACTIGSTVLLPQLSPVVMGTSPSKQGRLLQTHHLCRKLFSWFEARYFVSSTFPFLSKLSDVEIFGAGKPRLSGLSPIAVDGMDYGCHLCPWIDFFSPASVCHPLYVLGQKLNSGITERQAAGAALALLEEAAQTNRAAGFRLRVQAVKVFPGQQETHAAVKCRGKVYIPCSSLICFVLMPVACPFLPAYLILVQFLSVSCLFRALAQKTSLKNPQVVVIVLSRFSSLDLHLSAPGIEILVTTGALSQRTHST